MKARAHLLANMRRLTGIDLSGVLLGIILIGGGLIMVIWPTPQVLFHFTNNALGLSAHYEAEFVSASGQREYGAVAVLVGAGILAAALTETEG